VRFRQLRNDLSVSTDPDWVREPELQRVEGRQNAISIQAAPGIGMV
jgi:hypothetical protein